MEPLTCQINRSACRLCQLPTLRPLVSQWPRSYPIAHAPQRPRHSSRRWASNMQAPAQIFAKSPSSVSQAPVSGSVSSRDVHSIQELSNKVLKHASIPTEAESLKALRAIEYAARTLVGGSTDIPTKGKVDEDPASALLSLDARPTPANSQPAADAVNTLSNLAYKLVKHPAVFITPNILSSYVAIQSLLGRPSSFPEFFILYTSKPRPTLEKGSNRIIYKPQNPRAIATAIPADLANIAIDAAIAQRDLALSLEIINQTFRSPSYKRSKLFRKALPPTVAAALAPFAAYSLALNLSTMQLGLPAEDFTMFAFAGILTYGTAVGTIGYVALTTTNDQMERVTWAIGMPLWERWLREEERAACDRVANAWGFRDRRKWGEEVGAEWDELREWLGYRAMILDKVSLMDGME